jgi:hypothetical protein
MKKVFPTLKDDWGIYMPEVKYLSPEVKVDYKNLSLIDYPNVHFVGIRCIISSWYNSFRSTRNLCSRKYFKINK